MVGVILDSFLFIDKPQNLSSFDVIRVARKALRIKKIGHSGTLDPQATGLLILAINKATRLLPYLPSEPKKYDFKIKFGETTDTLDSEGNIIDKDKPVPSLEILNKVIGTFHGTIQQKPPIFSAIKVNGKRAYKLARQNKEVNLPIRKVKIYSMSITDYNREEKEASFTTECSKGTYIRSIARDIAEKAGTIGYVSFLRRTAIGKFSVNNAANIEDLKNNAEKYLVPIHDIFRSFPSCIIYNDQIKKISYGHEIEINNLEKNDTLFLFNSSDKLIAVAEHTKQNRYRPKKVLINP